MKALTYFTFILFSPLMSRAQIVDGSTICLIGQNWNFNFLTERAQRQHKYILIDFFSTSSIASRKINKNLPCSEEPDTVLHDRFITLKVMTDTIKALELENLCKKYDIRTFPTLLFLSPKGYFIRKEDGFRSKSDFDKLLIYSLNVSLDYDSLFDLYWKHSLSCEQMQVVANYAQNQGDKKLADKIAMECIDKYLRNASDMILMSKKNLEFLSNFTDLIKEGDRFFELFYNRGKEVDAMLGNRGGYCHDVIQYVLTRDEVNKYIYGDSGILVKRPNWKDIRHMIRKKYSNEFADDIVIPAELHFYEDSKDWKRFIIIFDSRLKKQYPNSTSNFMGGFGDVWTINVAAWNLFLHCKDRKLLKSALRWSNISIGLCNNNGELLQLKDTKANLLYKLGRVSDAIQLEENVVLASSDWKEFKINLDRMRSGIPTWPSE